MRPPFTGPPVPVTARSSESPGGALVQVKCALCGDGGHPTSDCPTRTGVATTVGGRVGGATSRHLEAEYNNFISELGGQPPPPPTSQPAPPSGPAPPLVPAVSGPPPQWAMDIVRDLDERAARALACCGSDDIK
eukprot:944422-Prorocentrum_minimum.AAC.1